MTCLACWGPLAAHAQPAPGDARSLFRVGARAFADGRYEVAIQAFEQALTLVQLPALYFSLAQAQRRQLVITPERALLVAAQENYRRYLELEPQGKRRAEAVEGLMALEGQAANLPAELTTGPPAPEVTTRLAVTSSVEGALVSLDGAPPVPLPFAEPTEPGPHRLRITAPGWSPLEREVTVPPGSIYPVDLPLQPLPGTLTFAVPDGTTLTLDGLRLGEAPLSAVEVQPGEHQVVASRNGHLSVVRKVRVGRGEQAAFQARLKVSPQRVAAYALLGIGAGSLAAGGVAAGLAFDRQSRALELQERSERGNLSAAELEQYQTALLDRNGWRLGAGVGITLGLAFLVAGGLAYLLDEPVLPAYLPRKETPDPQQQDGLELGLQPAPWPAGLALGGRF